ncbi:MAG TPA: hypothetical protein PLE92_04690 [Lentisphaeria bacterium]|mgnify:CR=1 FL=1|nr:hypothetical protein [Lentisphaerota bacterium]OQC13203.1 MAG: hypothetical protein BWX73_02478 [Lentisphaerae bacterium ADurb.Bin082]HQC52407.1 hypothetical protein [Lentisphaeria bacterium]HQL86952.1 hypothetical protein [Lentisphaeria bacterium]
MRFNRFGKSFQMAVDNGRDLEEVLLLDDALWAATSAPANVFFCDPLFIQHLDTEAKGRVTSADLKQAIRWFLLQLPDRESITPEFDGNLPLDAIAEDTEAGQALRNSALYILKELEVAEATTISLAQIRTFFSTVKARALNGDGVLSMKSAGDHEDIKNLITHVVAATGGTQDLDGSIGMGDKELKDFLAAIPLYLEWLDRGAIPPGQDKTEIMPLGANTPALAALLKTNAARVEQFFQLSRLLQFDGRLQSKALAPDTRVAAFDPANQPEVEAYANSLPLAPPSPEAVIPVDPMQINPVFRAWWHDITEKIIQPLLGPGLTAITQNEWNTVKAIFAPYEAYLASKKGNIVEKLPPDVLRSYLTNPELFDDVQKLLAADKAVADTLTAAKAVEKLLLFRTYLLRFANNFVNFSELYGSSDHAMFESGSLVIDGRWFHVSLQVDNVAAHQALAKSSLLFIMYVEIQKSATEKITVVVPVTSGNRGNLVVGKRGVFFDLKGVDYDAKLVQVIENPVCIREALIAPFSRLWGIVESKIEAWSGAAEKGLQQSFTKAITPGAAPAPAPPPAPVKAADGKMNSGAFLGVSVAVAALGSALAFITKTVASMSGLQIWITVICAILAVIFPITLMAAIKLSRQDLSALLEGCGWAINLRMRLDPKLRAQFTNFGVYPKDAEGTPKSHWLKTLLISLALIVLISLASYGFNHHRKAKKAERLRQEQLQQEMAKEKAAAEATTAAASDKAPAPEAAAPPPAETPAAAPAAAAP